jgi:hypothetical protein
MLFLDLLLILLSGENHGPARNTAKESQVSSVYSLRSLEARKGCRRDSSRQDSGDAALNMQITKFPGNFGKVLVCKP